MTTVKWESIRAELDQAEWFEEDGFMHRRVFIGTERHIYASGKDFRLFDIKAMACLVCQKTLKPCTKKKPCIPQLDGTELHCDFCLDQSFNEIFIQEAAKRNLYVTCDNEDGRDIFIGEKKPITNKK